MSQNKAEKRDERTKDNADGLVCVRDADGSLKHVTREEWAKILEEGENAEPESPEN